jgi:competence protein ComEC
LLLACAYAVFSGWGVPAQRTVWMLAAVVVIDPWALYQAGFWLSFVAVGVLFAAGSVTTALPSVSSDPTEQVISQNGSILVRFHARIRA